MLELIPFLMFLVAFAALLSGYAVAPTIAGVALMFGLGGFAFGAFDLQEFGFLPGRIFGIVSNQVLVAVPLFILMGVTLEKSQIAETLLIRLSGLAGGLPGGLGLAVVLVGMLMAASTGIVGATVVTMGLLSLPLMLKNGYDPRLATGTIVATGTLGQIIPPSIVLVLLGDVLSTAYQQAQLGGGILNPKTVSVGDLFAGALIPGLLLVAFFAVYVLTTGCLSPGRAPSAGKMDGGDWLALVKGLFPPLALICTVLGSILWGVATPTEAAGVGACGALAIAWSYGKLTVPRLRAILESTMKTTCMVFFILIAASLFSLVFRGYGGDHVVHGWFEAMPGGHLPAVLMVMAVIFLLGFVLDFVEITYVVLPIVAPGLLQIGVDPVWLGILIAVNLQTSFLTPPFGFALFYLRGVAPQSVRTTQMYRGVVPFIALQLLLLGLLFAVPSLATWLPRQL